MELIDCRQMISSSTIGACTIVVDAWGASTCCSMDVFKVGRSTYYKTSLGGMPMFIFSSFDHRHSQMLASNKNLVDFSFFYGQMNMNPNFIHTMMQNTFMLKCASNGCKCVFTNSNQISPFMWEQVEVVNWGGG